MGRPQRERGRLSLLVFSFQFSGKKKSEKWKRGEVGRIRLARRSFNEAWARSAQFVFFRRRLCFLFSRSHRFTKALGPPCGGQEECRSLWKQSRMLEMSLVEMVDLCRRCHRLAPFTNYNGNTFSAIARFD
jgi:hypothetical protein